MTSQTQPPAAESPREAAAAKLLQQLDQFTGTEQWYRYSPLLFRKVLLTDGTKFIADTCGAYWLFDAIASHLPSVPKKEYIAFAKIVTDDQGHTTLTLQDDDPPRRVYAKQEFDSDFPLPELLLYIGFDDPDNIVICLMLEH